MDDIIVRIKCSPKYHFLNHLREQGLLFDTMRQSLNVDDDGLQEITDKEYELFENGR